MDFNFYNIYSRVSSYCDSDEKEMIKIIENFQKLEKMDNSNDAKNFVKEIWNIDKDVKNHALCKNCFLNLEDTEELLMVNLSYKNENITCYYDKKGV